MKSTLDLPDHLVRQAKQRALQQGRSLKDLVADYIRLGLHGEHAPPSPIAAGAVQLDAGGLPLYRRDPEVTTQPPDLKTALQLEQHALLQEDRRRAGLPA